MKHASVPPPPARGWYAAVQWVLIVVYGLVFVVVGIGLVTATIHSLTMWVRAGASDWWPQAREDLSHYGIPFALGLGAFSLFGFLIRDCIYRLIGKDIPPSSGGGFYA